MGEPRKWPLAVTCVCAYCGKCFELSGRVWNMRLTAQTNKNPEKIPLLFCSNHCAGSGVRPRPRVKKLQWFNCKCGVTFSLLPSTARKRLKWLEAFGGELYCSRLCAVNYSPNGTWPTFIKAYDEMEEQAVWDARLAEDGLTMERGWIMGQMVQHPLYRDQETGFVVEFWTLDPAKQRQFAYGGSGHSLAVETIIKLRAAKLGARNPQFGRVRTQAENDQVSKTLTGRPLSAEHRQHLSERRQLQESNRRSANPVAS